MKKATALISLFLSVALLLSACSSEKSVDSGTTAPGTDSTTANEETYTVRYAFRTLGTTPRDMLAVQEEMSKITEEKFNVKLELLPIGVSSYLQQLTLMISSGEKLDMMTEQGGWYSNDVANNKLLQLDDLLQKYGQGAVTATGDFLKAASINGKTFAVPVINDKAQSFGIVMRKDILDKYNIDPSNIKTYDDITEMFKTVQAGEPNLVMVSSQSQARSIYQGLCQKSDILGDEFGVLENWGQDLKVVNLFETKEYADNLKTIRDWYNNGYVLKDNPTNSQAGQLLVKSGKLFSFVTNLKPGYDQQSSNQTGFKMVSTVISPAFSHTGSVTGIMMALPITCKNPEKTMQVLDLMYTNSDLVNLIDWGIEGKHYVKTDETNVIDFPQGVDASSTGYGLNLGWQFGNQLISHVWKGDSPDLYVQLDNFNKTAKKSKATGFSFNGTTVKSETAALANVCNQYRAALEDGLLDPDTDLPKFIAALKDAGIDKVIAEKQKQLDEWAKAQGIQ